MMRRVLSVLLFFFAYWCAVAAKTGDNRLADELLEKAVRFSRSELDSSEWYAGRAFDVSEPRSLQRLRSLRVLASVSFRRMDYVRSRILYKQLEEQSASSFERMRAEIGLMKICQRVSDNIEFYEHRNEVLQLLQAFETEEYYYATPEEREEVKRLEMEFRMVSALYFFELEQAELSERELSYIIDDLSLRSDTSQYVKLLYMQGQGAGLSEGTRNALSYRRLKSLELCVELCRKTANEKMLAMAMRAIADLLLEYGHEYMCGRMGSDLLENLSVYGVSSDYMATLLTTKSLQILTHYGDLYETIHSYITLAACYIEKGEYEAAVNELSRSLNIINENMRLCFPGMDRVPLMGSFQEGSEIVELEWLEQVPYAFLPEAVSTIRRYMSLAYSGLDNKAASDYNRDVYLEIQRNIRTDRHYEARKAVLERLSHRTIRSLVGTVVVLLLFGVFYLLLNALYARRNKAYMSMLERLTRLCERLLAPIPYASDPQSVLAGRVREEFGQLWERRGSLDGDTRTILKAIEPYMEMARRNSELLSGQEEERKELSKLHDITLHHAEEGVKENVVRRSLCRVVAETMPYIERMRAEVLRLSVSSKTTGEWRRRLAYMAELARGINEYNNLLQEWIQMRRGVVSLSLQQFELQSLFDVVGCSTGSFAMKGVELNVVPTKLSVYADKVLTLFMINTLLSNARKYTPKGGHVELRADWQENWVEISVSDTGIGLSEEDIRTIVDTKVFDPQNIGVGAPGKGSGFGLLNCKGIIEKYQKSHDLFSVCSFGAESEPGRGSRFFFRLPKALKRMVCLLLLVALPAFSKAQYVVGDSLVLSAYNYAKKVYEANSAGDYAAALHYADLALTDLNFDFLYHNSDGGRLLTLYDDNSVVAPEVEWLRSGFWTDYETILWLRNEIAVSALALRSWDLYFYNDKAYMHLFKLYYSEDNMARDCRELQISSSNRAISLALTISVCILVFILHSIQYLRRRLLTRSELQQMLNVVNSISKATEWTVEEILDRSSIMEAVIQHVQKPVENLWNTKRVVLGMPQEEKLITTSGCDSLLEELMDRCFESGAEHHAGLLYALPLTVSEGECPHKVGVVGLELEREPTEMWTVTRDMVMRYLSQALYCCVERIERGQQSIEELKDETMRLEYEDERLHVSNMVMDNSLSTLKHETTWYPNRILQLISELEKGDGGEKNDLLTSQMVELVTYYRGLYGLLSGYVLAQSEERHFQLEQVDAASLLMHAEEYHNSVFQNGESSLVIDYSSGGLRMTGNRVLLEWLVELLLQVVCQEHAADEVRLSVKEHEGNFLKFELYMPSLLMDREVLEVMFTPKNRNKSMDQVLCRQIIRELDTLLNHAGCALVPEKCVEGGTVVWFTVCVA